MTAATLQRLLYSMRLPVRLALTLGLTLYCNGALASAHILIVAGLGGNPEYTRSFNETAETIAGKITSGKWRGGEASLTLLSGEQVERQSILHQLQQFRQELSAEDSLVIMLIGHGSYDGEHYRFNIPGPDLSGDDLKQGLEGIAATEQLLVLATSASGVMLQQLTQSGRIVITATKSGGEINAVIFPEYWARALSTDKADFDQNEIVTVAEAFRYTSNAVAAHYSDKNLLASEHPRLLGEGAGQQVIAYIGSLQQLGNDPQIIALLEQRTGLEAELEALKARKSANSLNSYYEALQELMLRMARLQLDIDRKSGWTQ